ncbi:MAG: tetratricopeptide repeat protein [Caldilineaceae bacterium]
MNDSQPKKRRRWFSGEPFERLVALLIAVVTLITAVVAYLDADASGRSATAYREAQQFSIQAMGARARGEVLAGYAWTDAYRTWLELDTQSVLAKADGDEQATDRYVNVRDRIATLTPLLQPPYFDASTQDRPNLRAYESDLYIEETTAMTEHFTNAYRIADGWGEKSGAYLIHLTLLTVSLFLYGLSTTVSGRMSWLFIVLGSILSLVTLVWMISVVQTPVYAYPKGAITAYAHGVGLAHQQRYDEAVTSFNHAIELEPDYVRAYYQRANAYNALNKFQEAAADYAANIELGAENINVFWNYGWTFYRMGDYDQAVVQTEAALADAPDQVALYFNKALMQLAAGKVEDANTTYQAGMNLVSQEVTDARQEEKQPPSSLWWYLDTAVLDLHHLYNCAKEQKCEGAPPTEKIVQPEQSAELAHHWAETLQNLSVSLEYSDQISQSGKDALAAVQLNNISFTKGVYDASGKLVAYSDLNEQNAPMRFGMVNESQGEEMDTSLARAGTAINRDLFVNFKYQGMKRDQLLVMKVFLGDREASGLRLITKWSLGESGSAILPLTPGRTFTLAPGDYRVELYVDAQLVQTGTFTLAS